MLGEVNGGHREGTVGEAGGEKMTWKMMRIHGSGLVKTSCVAVPFHTNRHSVLSVTTQEKETEKKGRSTPAA
eukprot:1462120-Rhodomonas_salina.2